MGNYNFKSAQHQPGTIVKIVHDKYSQDQEIPDDLMSANNRVRIVKTSNLFKSRADAPDVTVSKVQTKDNTFEAYLTINLTKV